MHIALLITTWAAGCASFTQTRARNVSWNRYSQKASTTSATQPRHRRTAIRVPSKSKESPNESSRDAATRLPDIRTSADDVAANLSLVSLITAFTAIQWARAAIYYCVDFSSKVSALIQVQAIELLVDEGFSATHKDCNTQCRRQRNERSININSSADMPSRTFTCIHFA